MSVISSSETKLALGGDVTIGIVAEESWIASLLPQIWRQIYGFEKQFSRFLPNSELSRFNKNAGTRIPISEEFKNILICAKELSIKTEGLYNPFILPALQKAGYLQSAVEGYESDIQDDHSAKKVVDVNRLEIGDTWAMIPYGTAIDLGGCGKGFLADLIGSWLKKEEVTGFWLSFSGDIAVWGMDENTQPIQVAIQDASNPIKQSDWLISCQTMGMGVATSGTLRRPNQSSLTKHHIIDPRTSQAADTDIVLATVCAQTTVQADVLASCAVILGSDKSTEFLKKLGVSSAFIQYQSGGQVKTKKFGDNIKSTKSIKKVVQHV